MYESFRSRKLCQIMKCIPLFTFIFSAIFFVYLQNTTISNANLSWDASLHHYLTILAYCSTNILLPILLTTLWMLSSLHVLHRKLSRHLACLPLSSAQTKVFRNHLNSNCSPQMPHLLEWARIHSSVKSSLKTLTGFVT